jgi:hypothetical protein
MNDLLEPSLQEPGPATRIYSIRSSFLVAFLGGPFAITLFSALNSRRLGRLPRDLPFYAIGLLATVLVIAWIWPENGARSFVEFAEQRRADPMLRYGARAVGLVLFGYFSWMHRVAHRSVKLVGDQYAKPWLPAIACMLIGGVIQGAVTLLVNQLRL